MMRAKDHRANAMEALRGRWGVAIITAILAGLLTGGLAGGMNLGSGGQELGLQQMESMNRMLWAGAATSLVFGIVLFLISGAVEMGYARFNLGLIDRQEARLGMLFGYMDRIGRGIGMVLLRAVYLILWMLPSIIVMTALMFRYMDRIVYEMSMVVEDPVRFFKFYFVFLAVIILLSIPGVVATYRYLLTSYIMAEDPEIRAKDALRKSVELMRGYKWKAFCLRLSFFGWILLIVFTLGIAGLWVQPYMMAAEASFYREVCRCKAEQPADGTAYLHRGPEL